MLRLVGGLLELSVEMDCEYLDVHVDDEMNATTMHESISKTHAEVNIPERDDKTEEESIPAVESKTDAVHDRVHATAPMYTSSAPSNTAEAATSADADRHDD